MFKELSFGRWTMRFQVAVALAFLLTPLKSWSQQAVTLATVSGRVDDPTGLGLAAVSVTATSTDRGQAWTTETDTQGRYRFLFLPVDSYKVHFEHAGFDSLDRNLTVTVGQAIDVSVHLALKGQRESIDVNGDEPMVEAVRTQISETIVPHDVENLPLNGRNFLDLAALTPGVTRSNPVANQRFPETSSVPGTGLSITGQRFISNGFVVDGLSSNDDAADLPGTFYSQEVIREFQVIASGGIAEFGRAAAGTINILTQSGTNEWRGRAYGFFRDDALDEKNPLAPAKDPLRQWQYGVSIAGPLRLNQTFVFANLEQTRQDDSSVITIAPASVETINARLSAVAYPGPPITTGLFDTGYHATNGLVRVDHRLNERQLLSVRYNIYRITSDNARNVGGINAISRGTALEDTDQTMALNFVATLSSRTLNETRAQFTRSRLGAPPNDLIGPAVTISGVAAFGVATSSPTARDLDLFELANVTTTQRGAHTLKAGVDFLLNRADITFPGALQGSYTFASLAAFQVGAYSTYQQAFGAANQFQSNPNVGAFVQDEWRATRALTFNAGLRYDLQFLPEPIQTDTNNVSPRFGLAFSPGSGKTVFRGSVGLYFDRVALRATSNALQRDGSRYRVALYAQDQPGAPTFPATASAFPAGFLPSVTTIDPRVQNGRSIQSSLQMERQLGGNSSITVGYLGSRGAGILLSRNINVPIYTAAEALARGIPNLGRPNSAFGNIARYESLGESQYDAMAVSFRRRFSGVVSARLSYTLSKAKDDAGNAFFFTPQDNADVRGDWGLADNDQRHRLALSGTLQSPAGATSRLLKALSGFELGYVFSYGSALPFNIVTGGDRNNDTTINDRPEGVARNSGHGFDFASLDLRMSRRFRFSAHASMEAILEGFNVLNRANYQLPNGTFGTGVVARAGFGAPTAAADPRQIQLGLRFNF